MAMSRTAKDVPYRVKNSILGNAVHIGCVHDEGEGRAVSVETVTVDLGFIWSDGRYLPRVEQQRVETREHVECDINVAGGLCYWANDRVDTQGSTKVLPEPHAKERQMVRSVLHKAVLDYNNNGQEEV